MSRVARESSEAEIEALEALCDRLSGFGADVAVEWVDGYLTALLASRRVILPGEWLPAMFGDAFGRAFADPADVEQAMAALTGRWNVIASQLDVEAMLDAPDELRLVPLMWSYDDEARAEVVAGGHMTAEDANDLLQTGALWAEGFVDAIEAFAEDWPEPDVETEDGRWYDDCQLRVTALTLGQADLAEHLADYYPGETVTRDQLVDDACFAVQDLRLYWLDHAPRPEPRHVEPRPGRNDPCPCGSGKKYKKCHGAAVQ
ncbi:MAG: UPF0149 family protein [Burkholderiaceae bacterium]|nr:UPF0149 family protein [Burkholderiaceae bacterium]